MFETNKEEIQRILDVQRKSYLAEGVVTNDVEQIGPGQTLSSYARRAPTSPLAAIPALRHPDAAALLKRASMR